MTKNNKESAKLTAKRDFVIHFNQHKIIIKKGDDLSKKKIPDILLPNLKTEKVI